MTTPAVARSFLQLDTPWVRVLAALLLLSLPTHIVLSGYRGDTGFLSLIYFGAHYLDRALPEVQALDPPADWPWGYDGQFYAQLALDPLLTRPELGAALDLPRYRSQRIGLPLLAHGLGLGVTGWTLQAYALLNYGFWIGLLIGLYRYIRPRILKDYLLIGAILWSSGTLISLARALTDFPAAALCLMAVWLRNRRWIASGMLALAGLVRETSLLSLPAVVWPGAGESAVKHRWLLALPASVLPVLIWHGYVGSIDYPLATDQFSGIGNLTYPFIGLADKLSQTLAAFGTGAVVLPLIELTAVASLLVQAVYLLSHWRFSSPAWRMGIGFALLLFFLSAPVLVEFYAYCRVLLPLTLAFNGLIYEYETGKGYLLWLVAGNLGLGWMVPLSLF